VATPKSLLVLFLLPLAFFVSWDLTSAEYHFAGAPSGGFVLAPFKVDIGSILSVQSLDLKVLEGLPLAAAT